MVFNLSRFRTKSPPPTFQSYSCDDFSGLPSLTTHKHKLIPDLPVDRYCFTYTDHDYDATEINTKDRDTRDMKGKSDLKADRDEMVYSIYETDISITEPLPIPPKYPHPKLTLSSLIYSLPDPSLSVAQHIRAYSSLHAQSTHQHALIAHWPSYFTPQIRFAVLSWMQSFARSTAVPIRVLFTACILFDHYVSFLHPPSSTDESTLTASNLYILASSMLYLSLKQDIDIAQSLALVLKSSAVDICLEMNRAAVYFVNTHLPSLHSPISPLAFLDLYFHTLQLLSSTTSSTHDMHLHLAQSLLLTSYLDPNALLLPLPHQASQIFRLLFSATLSDAMLEAILSIPVSDDTSLIEPLEKLFGNCALSTTTNKY